MRSSVVSSATHDTGSPMILTWLPFCTTLAPLARARATSRSASGVRTCTTGYGRSGGGGGMSSPSSVRARERWAAPSFLTPGAEAAHSGPLMSVGTVNTKEATASGKLAIA